MGGWVEGWRAAWPVQVLTVKVGKVAWRACLLQMGWQRMCLPYALCLCWVGIFAGAVCCVGVPSGMLLRGVGGGFLGVAGQQWPEDMASSCCRGALRTWPRGDIVSGLGSQQEERG